VIGENTKPRYPIEIVHEWTGWKKQHFRKKLITQEIISYYCSQLITIRIPMKVKTIKDKEINRILMNEI
jgi:hypothetical protein